ncbi:MAG: futalosine hydrolase [Bacteroidia bacterium]|nr:futalosine hydrolase [Bacteroidia bacterium]
MKEILLVAATYGESVLIRKNLFDSDEESPYLSQEFDGKKISLIHTGIGMVNTALKLGSYLSHHKPDLMVNFGIAGAFNQRIQLGQVVDIREDIFADMGANSPSGFLDMKELGFPTMKKGGVQYFNSLQNPINWQSGLQKCRGISVNEISGVAAQVEFRKFKWEADVETMEGAAFFQAGLWFDIPFLAIRGISNYVEPRNRNAWEVPLALKNVQEKVLELLESPSLQELYKFRENI